MKGKRPYVFATARALKDAETIVPGGRVLELEVEDLIVAGQLVRDHPRGRNAWIVFGDRWLARADRRPSPLGTRRGWWVESVERRPG